MTNNFISDFAYLDTSTLDSKTNTDTSYWIYSFPSFDENKLPELKTAKRIKSIKDKVDSNTLLFNKLNVRFKRIWNLKEVPSNSLCSSEFLRLKTKRNCDQDFLFYFLQSNYLTNWFTGASGGTSSSHSRIDPNDLLNFKVDFPPIEIQEKIGLILSALDKKIDVNIKIKEELEQVAKTIYLYWFIQFEFPNEEGKPYKKSGGKMIWNEKLKREIPSSWILDSISRIGNIVSGSTPSKKNKEFYCMHGIPWLTPNDLSNNTGNKFISKGEMDITKKGKEAASLKIMPKGTVLLTSRAPVGYLAISREDVTTNQGFKSFVPDNGYTTEYIYYTLQTFMPTIINNSSGSTFKEISASMMEMVEIWLPPTFLVEKYSKLIEPIFEMQNTLELENKMLLETKEWLLPMLMAGQIGIK